MTGEVVSDNSDEDCSDNDSTDNNETTGGRTNDLGHVDVYYRAKTDRWWDEVQDTDDLSLIHI